MASTDRIETAGTIICFGATASYIYALIAGQPETATGMPKAKAQEEGLTARDLAQRLAESISGEAWA